MKKRVWTVLLVSIVLLTLVIINLRNYRQLPQVRQFPQLPAYRFPGEFEKQQAIWLQWPSEIYNLNQHPVNPVMVKIIKALARYIRVDLMVQSNAQLAEVRNLLKDSGFTGSNVHFYIINHQSIWTRDVGPIFVKDRQNRLNVVNFGFNNYSRGGNLQYIYSEAQVDRLVGELFGLPVIKASLISEGGAIESNGRGTLMTTASVALKRNPGLTKQQIEAEYKRVLGVRKVIWLNKGLAEDDRITGGHINEIARFADPHTVLLARVLQEERYASWMAGESYRRMEENCQILRNSTDQDGKPFKIIRIPMPPGFYQEANLTGSLPVRSYLNYAVTNGAVLIQTYWKPGYSALLKATEEQVKGIFQKVFPGRTIIGIDAEDVNRWGGGIHCITQHMPGS